MGLHRGRRARTAFLYNVENAIELMGAKFSRGVERLHQQNLQPSMFNMSAWMSQGIAESRTLGIGEMNEHLTNAIDHSRETVQFVYAIIANQETFGMSKGPGESIDRDGFVLLNEYDFRAYIRN